MQRAIPPDSSRRVLVSKDGTSRHEAVGDLHLAADNFAGAIDAYGLALAEAGRADVPGRVRLQLRIAQAEFHRGAYDASLSAARAAREDARLLGDARVLALIAVRYAAILNETANYRRSLRYARWAYETLKDSDEHRAVGAAALAIGNNIQKLGDPHGAIEWFQNACATYRRIDDSDGLVMALNNLGLIYKNLREWREAIRFLEQALSIDERKGLYARMRGHHQNLGLIRYRLGQWDLAEEHFRQSLRISVEVGHATSEAQALIAQGLLARRRRQYERAGEQFRRALELAAQARAARETQLAREFLAEIELDRGAGLAALQLLQPALEEALERAPQGDMAMELQIRMAHALQLVGRQEESRAHALRGLALAERLGDRIEYAIALRVIARLDAAQGQHAAMDARMREAAQIFEQLGEMYELASTLSAWGEYLLLLPVSVRMRVALEGVSDGARRAAAQFRQLGVVSLAAEALLTLARLESEREHFDQASSLLEQAESWLSEGSDPETEERAAALRREIERQYVAVSLSTCNEFRALEEANRLFRETSDMDGLLAQIVKLAVEHSGGDRGFLAFSSGAGRLDVVAQHGLGRDRARRIQRVLEGAAGARFTENGPVFSSRVAADPRFAPALTDALESVGSLVCVPLNFPSQSVGLVYVDRLNDNLLGAFKQRELNMLAVLANSAAVAIVEAQRSLLLAENQQLRDQLRPSPGSERIVTRSREIESVLQLLRKVGDSTATILFMGETGTGKGLFAQVVHEISHRRDRPFVQVNCAALPDQLLESELFGYVQGAFTGAARDKIGLFEEADGGTIFLDEIEKIPENVQAKLLHVLDRGEIRPVGATRNRKVDARVICATSSDLRDRIREGRFLEDLYYRLNDITVRVPALRQRREDIALLAQHFLALYARQMDKPVRGFTPEVLRVFLAHEWRGNVRELEKTVKRMVVLADDGAELGLDLLPSDVLDARPAAPLAPPAAVEPARSEVAVVSGRPLRDSVAELEKQVIAEALARLRGNKARVARELGLSYPTLLGRIRAYGLEGEHV
ncbi:MAG: sigma 54-interacting transcriptional regulator [Candidatus Eisenbacteria bacterium]|uniref:Sigma 54-interacting transcriptional regulator n=1 Tax=Eiseniibacteriota bacterium TaxID=2212470 RepID=A0A933SEF5_UNCEI|nr:sigma 54-interacting transcriptional regulator [Candidatus Eisenbacteria bacterium]